MRYHFEKLRTKTRFLAFSVIATLCFQTLSASATASNDLKQMFRHIDKQLCRSFSIDRCTHKKRRAVSKAQPQKEVVPSKPAVPLAPVSPPKVDDNKAATKQSVVLPTPIEKNKAIAGTKDGKHPSGPVPIPTLRPENLGAKDVPVPTPQASPAQVPKPQLAPKPVPAPEPQKKEEQSAIPKSPPVTMPPVPPVADAPVIPPTPPVPHPMPDNTLFGEACFSELQKLGVKFERLPVPMISGVCSVWDPVKVSGVQQGENFVKFPDSPTLNCGFALRLGSWVKEQAAPIVQSNLSTSIATIGTGPGFQCRGRNGDSSAKVSEHGFGNAVDIERLKLTDGQVVEVVHAIDTSSKYQPVLAALRAAGCQYFMTVLGPGANSAHASHFHFDLERRGKKGNNRMCE